ncbi:PREDICTED: uncharacterized protein LOC107349577 isoform X2 [Acropora digitifera]|uniref:uncharacterized protein LOC107349577 isoform X2 n=1 Tax=Acropora digitifera TaxID=70779 RepID=UPI00077ABF7E|nr:PREDICTED: uncharacterized protein LOC107349577 isoform X2 [Acropora digitifera]
MYVIIKKYILLLLSLLLLLVLLLLATFVFGLRHRWTYLLRTLPDIAPFLEPLERAIADLLVPAITKHVTTQEERDLLELPVRLGGLGLVNPARTASQEYEASIKITGPLLRQIIKQAHKPPDETEITTLQASARREKGEWLKMQCEQVRECLPSKTERVVELATEKGASNWLTVIPIKEMNFNLNKREFRDAIKLRYDWEIADLLAMCTDVEIEPVLQEITWEELNRGANSAPDARLEYSRSRVLGQTAICVF